MRCILGAIQLKLKNCILAFDNSKCAIFSLLYKRWMNRCMYTNCPTFVDKYVFMMGVRDEDNDIIGGLNTFRNCSI